VIALVVRWHPRSLPYLDAGELLAGRGVTVDRVTTCRWGQRFISEFTGVAR
jgi:transposase-like protein